ncbi:hypothetical protein GOODEAATRI_021678 [Goodea atripinnis]|uniref:GST C-terminal domain-containing protein n=1 Tax=Goodea atripinnis TaxID=208336 RepID=A0ABV0PFV6_9TELE
MKTLAPQAELRRTWFCSDRSVYLQLMIPKIMGVEVPKEKMDGALEDLNNSLNLIEEKYLQDRAFIVGEQISLADLVAIVEIMQLLRIHTNVPLHLSLHQPVGAGLDVFNGRPKLSAWRDRVQAFIGKELFDEAHQAILGVQENMKQFDPSKLELFKPKILRLFF